MGCGERMHLDLFLYLKDPTRTIPSILQRRTADFLHSIPFKHRPPVISECAKKRARGRISRSAPWNIGKLVYSLPCKKDQVPPSRGCCWFAICCRELVAAPLHPRSPAGYDRERCFSCLSEWRAGAAARDGGGGGD